MWTEGQSNATRLVQFIVLWSWPRCCGTRVPCAENGIDFVDFWYMDNGRLLCKPGDVDAVLRAFDEVAARVGAVRG